MSDPERHAYDVVVAGAGPAGCAVASRLSENPALDVLLLEAGPDWRVQAAPPEIYMRGWVAFAGIESMAPFEITGIPVTRFEGAEPGMYFAGQGIGGSSIVNGQACLRPPLDSYERWGWAPEMALDLWKRIESDTDFGDRPEHGANGWLSIERARMEDFSVLDRAFWAAAIEAGHTALDDFNSLGSDGIAPIPYGRRAGRRVTANDAYIEPARHRPNLTVIGNARAARLILDVTGERVVGVVANVGGEETTYSADYFVASGGTIGTGGLLMRSGIGPADDLLAFGIDVKHDLPVGRRIQDHVTCSISLQWKPPRSMMGKDVDFARVILRYSSGLGDAPQGDMVMGPMGPLALGGIVLPAGIMIQMLETFSRGWLRLRSTNPDDWPAVHLGMWSDERDIIRMRDAVRKAVDLLDSDAFEQLGRAKRTIGVAMAPLGDLHDDAAVDEMLRTNAQPHAHISCSAPMGEPGSATAVVDYGAKVIGVDNLWIADLSICPQIVRAGPYATAMVIGEFVSDVMREELGSAGFAAIAQA